jgi:hypothetical protein
VEGKLIYSLVCVLKHNLVRHGPWYVETYGSLAVWNNQGMEKSHHAAKAANQHHTQHGETKERTSSIVQQYQHWYRNIQHRFFKQERIMVVANERSLEDEAIMVAGIEKRRTAYNTSSAKDAARRWRDRRSRVGRVWMSNVETDVLEDGGSIDLLETESVVATDDLSETSH